MALIYSTYKLAKAYGLIAKSITLSVIQPLLSYRECETRVEINDSNVFNAIMISVVRVQYVFCMVKNAFQTRRNICLVLLFYNTLHL